MPFRQCRSADVVNFGVVNKSQISDSKKDNASHTSRFLDKLCMSR